LKKNDAVAAIRRAGRDIRVESESSDRRD